MNEHKEALWNAYSAGAERTVPDPIEDWDSLRDDFESWFQATQDQRRG